jgi:gluconokinase
VFDGDSHQVAEFGCQLPYRVTTTQDGGVEVDADELAALSVECLDKLHEQLAGAGLGAGAVAFSAFWHSFLGVDANDHPTTPIIHLFDTRSAAFVEELKKRIDPEEAHQTTGCVLHTSYWPAKLLWLHDREPAACASTRRWFSFGEYLYGKLFGRPRTSTSMVSGSGIWNPNLGDYADPMLALLPVKREQLAPVSEIDEANDELAPEFRARWPRFQGIPWFPSLGDGACNNVGSGCVSPDRFALMVGTSGAMRAVIEAQRVPIPRGLWCYRVDRRRFVVGGALSNGGEVHAWMRRTLALPADEELDETLAAMQPGAHGLTVLPFFAGERSPYWRGDLRAVIAGMGLSTRPEEIVRAALESVALRFRQIYRILSGAVGEPAEVIASGGALLRSRAWTQMMADSLGRPLIACNEQEASSRGAALLALERIGAIGHLRERPARMSGTYQPVASHEAVYDALLREQESLFEKLWE